MNAIEKFVKELTEFQSTEIVYNPYLNVNAAKNLHIYLEEIEPFVLHNMSQSHSKD